MSRDADATKLDPLPDFIAHRIQLFEKLKAQYDEAVSQKPRDKINVTLDNDRIEIGTAWETTPAWIARHISKSLSERVVIARVDGQLWDLDRPLEKSCRLELLDFEHPEGSSTSFTSITANSIDCLHRKEGVLALQRTCSRGSMRAKIWLSPLHRTACG